MQNICFTRPFQEKKTIIPFSTLFQLNHSIEYKQSEKYFFNYVELTIYLILFWITYRGNHESII